MIRSLEESDYYKGFMDLINTFTRYPLEHTYEKFCEIYKKIQQQNSHVYVIEVDDKIVSSGKIFFEQKFHNNFKFVGHIEDIVTLESHRGNGYATSLLHILIEKAKEMNCYKIVLSSNEFNKSFYIKKGFMEKGSELCMYLL